MRTRSTPAPTSFHTRTQQHRYHTLIADRRRDRLNPALRESIASVAFTTLAGAHTVQPVHHTQGLATSPICALLPSPVASPTRTPPVSLVAAGPAYVSSRYVPSLVQRSSRRGALARVCSLVPVAGTAHMHACHVAPSPPSFVPRARLLPRHCRQHRPQTCPVCVFSPSPSTSPTRASPRH
ncbi:hypothetical protein FIBSPDRAFT_952491 [Athelia psychrophila]|uniref:Uncharacterized protein n=1 Tax=Athelia psychrophila TaxID=1759441 RepID=A0A166LG69_9AGAM|nr:hypothetical protein FIBSPDRAFT_952491 [Fibularhizoctonia sp. CBS 109695]